MRVKCRGYDGELVQLYGNTKEDITGHTVFVTYDVHIKLKPGEEITLYEIPPVEIEVINAKPAD